MPAWPRRAISSTIRAPVELPTTLPDAHCQQTATAQTYVNELVNIDVYLMVWSVSCCA